MRSDLACPLWVRGRRRHGQTSFKRDSHVFFLKILRHEIHDGYDGKRIIYFIFISRKKAQKTQNNLAVDPDGISERIGTGSTGSVDVWWFNFP